MSPGLFLKSVKILLGYFPSSYSWSSKENNGREAIARENTEMEEEGDLTEQILGAAGVTPRDDISL